MSFFKNLGPTEIFVIVLLLLFLFGSRKLVDLGRGLGEAKKELKTIKEDIKEAKKERG